MPFVCNENTITCRWKTANSEDVNYKTESVGCDELKGKNGHENQHKKNKQQSHLSIKSRIS